MADPGTCPKCGGATAESEQYCVGCGYPLKGSSDENDRVKESIGARLQKQSFRGKIKSGRTTILVCAVLFTLGTGILYLLNSVAIDKESREVLRYKGIDPWNPFDRT